MKKNLIKPIPKFVAVFIICLLGLLIYSNTFNSSWHFDDYEFIFDNPSLEDITDFKAIYNAYGNPARSVAFLTFALNYHFGRYDVFGYHIVNIAIHLITSVLVYFFTILILSSPRMLKEKLTKHKSWLGFFAALIFVAHPMQTQAITYITQRFASLATLFYIASLCCYLAARLSAGKKSYGFFTGAVVSAVLGMFTKQIVLTLPLAVLLIEFLFFNFFQTLKKLKKRQVVAVAIIVLSFMLIIPSFYSFRFIANLSMAAPSRSHSGDYLTPLTYFWTQSRVVSTYSRLLFFPIGQNLDYDFVSSKSILEWKTALCFLFLFLIFLLGVKLYRRHVLIVFGIFWFFITLMVESTFITIKQVIFEHRCYLPSVGIALLMAAAVFSMVKNKNKAISSLLIIVATLSYLTYQRNAVWETEVTLWSDVMKKSPQKTRTYTHLGFA